VLLHAGLLVRHNGVMLDAAFDRLALAFAGGAIICHGDGVQPSTDGPSHHGKLQTCPVCVAATAAVAILPSLVAIKATASAYRLRIVSNDTHAVPPPTDLRPPSRGPPQAV
jgi:hypothetical protein